MKSIKERLDALRREMAAEGITYYLIPTSDYHDSEYVGEYFKARQFITGFTGSAGTALVTGKEAYLWTDARYFLQAEAQLAGTEIHLMKSGEEGVPTLSDFLEDHLEEGDCLGFDGRVVTARQGEEFSDLAEGKGAGLQTDLDLVDRVWEDRPSMACSQAWILEECYTGESAASKLNRLRQIMEQEGADIHLLTCLYDICWLLNLRGDDISYVPVVLSYMILTRDTCRLFIQQAAITPQVAAYLDQLGVDILPYDSFYQALGELEQGQVVMADLGVSNFRSLTTLTGCDSVIDLPNPSELMRAVKNPTQWQNLRLAHEKDAVAMIHFMYWLKTCIGKEAITELSASDYLEGLRRDQGAFELSFETISGYQEHGAIVHYGVTPETDVPLKAEGLLLVDSGGQYKEGTTDITRTYALGPVTQEMKEAYTRVLRSHLALANCKFLSGCTGRNLDILAREPLWEAGLDYKHGTGHGVGFVLNVHEGPNAFRFRRYEGVAEEELVPGMVTTDEPGLYLAGKFGIRLENELLCVKDDKNEYGQFMKFENLTYVPMDLDAVDKDQMSPKEIGWLNAYHAFVYEKMAHYFSGEELEFLKNATRAI